MNVQVYGANAGESAISCVCADKDGNTFTAVQTKKASDNAPYALLSFRGLKPATKYTYVVQSDTKNIASGSFKTQPDYLDRTPPPDFSFALVGANYVNDKPYDPPFKTPGGDFEIYKKLSAANPNFVIWGAGLDTYRVSDLDAKSSMCGRLAHARQFAPLAEIVSKTPNYGLLNNALAVSTDAPLTPKASAGAREALKSAFANPDGYDENICAYSFKYADAEFFVLDDSSARRNLDWRENRPVVLGAKQLEWLTEALTNSDANFKIVAMASSIANPSKTPDTLAYAEREKKALFDFLSQKKITGVVFLSASRKYFEAIRVVRAGGYPLFEIAAGSLTAKPAANTAANNYFRIPNSAMAARGFALVKIEGPENDRALTFSFVALDGKAAFTKSIKLAELKVFD